MFVTAVQLLRHSTVFNHLTAEKERKLFLLEARKEENESTLKLIFLPSAQCRVNVR